MILARRTRIDGKSMQFYKTRSFHAAGLALFLAGSACTTTSGGSRSDEPDQPTKAAIKAEPASVPASPPPLPAPASENQSQAAPNAPAATGGPQPMRVEMAPAPSVDEQLAFVKRHTQSADFTEADQALVEQLPSSPEPGSVAEAALALGLIKGINRAAGNGPTFSESDLGQPGSNGRPEAAPPQAKAKSLEQSCKERGLNLPDAVAENPLLGSASVAKQVVAALNASDNSAEFKNEIQAALKKQAGLWSEVSGATAAPASPPAKVDLPPETPSAPPPIEAAPSPAELAGGEASLAQAQALADRGDFQSAIKLAQSVPDASPLKPQATEKIKDFSNSAVQELRRKAATAFQTAMPVADPRTRAEYLRQAKGFLEEAIKTYPEASQLPTVRDNLRVISRDLEKLEEEAGAKKSG